MALGIKLDGLASRPFANAGDKGVWMNNSGDLVFDRGTDGSPQNISQALSGGVAAGSISVQLNNNSGSSFAILKPVSVNVLGEMQTVDVSNQDSAFNTIGVLPSAVSNTATGDVITDGKIENISGFTLGKAVFVSKTGTLTATKPSTGVGGFQSGDYCIRVGTTIKNQSNPVLIDLVINIYVVGTLP